MSEKEKNFEKKILISIAILLMIRSALLLAEFGKTIKERCKCKDE